MGLFSKDNALFAASGGLSTLGGGGPLAGALGIDGAQGAYFTGQTGNRALGEVSARNKLAGDANIQSALRAYADGTNDLNTTLARGAGDLDGRGLSELRNILATDAQTGSRMATDEVQNNKVLGQLFGKGGALERANAEEQQLASRGYQLQPEDQEAYGQAAGNIARISGQQEKSLAASLANRGLSAGPSGAAAIGFSGLAGNKFEQLAQAQTNIANKRMENNLNRLSQTRSYMTQLGGQGADAINQQFNRQLAGVQAGRDQLNKEAGLENDTNQIANQANLASMQDARDAKGKTLLQSFGTGLHGSAANIGMIPGKAASSAAASYTGGMG